ncbi:hypothetical protein H9Q13_00005 [Pontibacter sp. JH31]|uniref:Arm DNA-binding domain-containing protein n=1 Tax=Pontibacter aquaedesilientis TaxID=2766980 RepID=A0ABR7XD54_9BACT|nr:Arm DNA-binding domain-containing protein [Pontibacter aquaedesilientis]MBD1395533.1 hypothetical protein [Pontibacter aquaedesilientis]
MQSIVTSIILDTRRALKDGTYPVKLRVTFQRKQKYYPTEFSFTPENFDKMMSPKPGKFLKEDKLKLQTAEHKMNQIIQKLPHFSFNELDRRLLKNSSRHEAFSSYEEAIARLKEEGRLGNANFFESARNSLWCYVHGAPFTKIKGTTKKKRLWSTMYDGFYNRKLASWRCNGSALFWRSRPFFSRFFGFWSSGTGSLPQCVW